MFIFVDAWDKVIGEQIVGFTNMVYEPGANLSKPGTLQIVFTVMAFANPGTFIW